MMSFSPLSTKAISWVVLVLLFFSCQKGLSDKSNSENNLFVWAEGLDDKVSELEKVGIIQHEISLTEDQIKGEFHLSEIIENHRYLELKNSSNTILGDIDKIIFSDSLIFVLDLYLNNSLQVFDFTSGEEHLVFLPSGAGPGEMKTIADFDVDFENRKIWVFDEGLAKMLEFDFSGNFLAEKKVPLRANSFRRLGSDFVFSCVNNPNDHLANVGLSDLVVLDSSMNIIAGFIASQFDQRLSSFLPRDLLRLNSKSLTYLPRYQNEILTLDVNKKSVSTLLRINLEKFGLNQRDFVEIDESFVSKRKADGLFFTFGHHVVTPNWLSIKYDRFGGQELQIYYNKETGEVKSGVRINFDFKDLISYSFPMACSDNTCISVIKMQAFRDLDLDAFFEPLEVNGRDFSEMKEFIKGIEDFDQPVLLITDLK